METLIERLRNATGPSRDLDLAISAAINYRGEFGSQEWRWSRMGDEIRPADGKGCLDPRQFVPQWTASIDQALSLIETPRRGLTLYMSSNPDMGGRDWVVSGSVFTRVAARSWPLALCIAGLVGRKK